RGQVLAVAKADLQHARRRATEERVEIEPSGAEVDTEPRPEPLKRTFLAGRQPAGAGDKRTHGARTRRGCVLVSKSGHGRKMVLLRCEAKNQEFYTLSGAHR